MWKIIELRQKITGTTTLCAEIRKEGLLYYLDFVLYGQDSQRIALTPAELNTLRLSAKDIVEDSERIRREHGW